MEKRKFTIVLLLAALFALSFNSCKQEDPAKPLEVNMEKYATIKGPVLVYMDETVDAPSFSSIPLNHFSLTTSIANSDLNLLAVGNTGNWTEIFRGNEHYDTVSGMFTIRVPVGEGPTKVDLTLSDVHVGNYRYFDWDGNIRTAEVRFRFDDITVYPTEGETIVLSAWPYERTIINRAGDLNY